MYAEKTIHTKSFPNVETERLLARLEYMRVNLARLGRECEQKQDFRKHALQVINVERELTFRGVPYTRVTDGSHLALPVSQVRILSPHRGSGVLSKRYKELEG